MQYKERNAFLSYLFYIQWTLFNVISLFLNKFLCNCYNLSACQSLWLRSCFTLAIMIPFSLKNICKDGSTVKKIFNTFYINTPREIFGFISILLLFQSSPHISMNSSILFSFLVPFFVSFLSFIFLKEKIKLHTSIILILSFLIILFIYPEKKFNIYHFMLLGFVLARSFCYILTKTNSRLITANSMIISGSIIYMSILSFFVENKISLLKRVIFSESLLFLIIFITICYIGYIYCLRVSLSLIDNITYLQPLDFLRIFESYLISYFFLGETNSKVVLIGSCLIIFLNILNIIFSTIKK